MKQILYGLVRTAMNAAAVGFIVAFTICLTNILYN